MVAVVSVLSQTMLKPAGIRIRMSSAAVISPPVESVTVTVLMAVAGSPTKKLWFEAEEMEG